MKFADAGSAGDCGAGRDSFDCQAAAAFRYLKKNRAIDQIHLPRALVETEDRVRAEAGDGQIGESQFATRLRAGANSGLTPDKITDHSRARRRLFQQQFNVVHYLGDARFLQRRRARRSDDGN